MNRALMIAAMTSRSHHGKHHDGHEEHERSKHRHDGRYTESDNRESTWNGDYNNYYYGEGNEERGRRDAKAMMRRMRDDDDDEYEDTAKHHPSKESTTHTTREGSQAMMTDDYKMKSIDKETAMKWANGMKNADGTTGPHWTFEQTKQVQAQNGIGGDPLVFYLALNATYSDFCKMFKKHGINNLAAYVDAACAFWLNDTDAMGDGAEKLARYYEYVVEK